MHAHAQYQQSVVAEHGQFSATPDYLAHKSCLSCPACHARHAIWHPLLRLQVSLARSVNVMKETSFKMHRAKKSNREVRGSSWVAKAIIVVTRWHAVKEVFPIVTFVK